MAQSLKGCDDDIEEGTQRGGVWDRGRVGGDPQVATDYAWCIHRYPRYLG